MSKGFVIVTQFTPQVNTTSVFHTAECKPETCSLEATRYCEIHMLPGICGTANYNVNQDADKQKNIIQMAVCSPCASTQRIARHLDESMYPYHAQQVHHFRS
jgi:hypothetical protein